MITAIELLLFLIFGFAIVCASIGVWQTQKDVKRMDGDLTRLSADVARLAGLVEGLTGRTASGEPSND